MARGSEAAVASKPATATATRSAPRRRRAAPAADEPRKGALTWKDQHGREHGPIACGVHRSVEINETSTNDEPGAPEGFQPGCAECRIQFDAVVDAARRNGMP